MKASKTSTIFLKDKGLIQEDHSEFIIKFDNGKELSLNELLDEYLEFAYNEPFPEETDPDPLFGI